LINTVEEGNGKLPHLFSKKCVLSVPKFNIKKIVNGVNGKIGDCGNVGFYESASR